MNRRAVAGVAIALLPTMMGGALARAAAPPEEPPPPMSVWMRFEDPARRDRSSTIDSWAADCADGTLAWGRFGQALFLPGKGANGLHLPRPTAFFGTKAHAGTIALWVCPANPDTDFVIADFYVRSGNTLIDGNLALLGENAEQFTKGPEHASETLPASRYPSAVIPGRFRGGERSGFVGQQGIRRPVVWSAAEAKPAQEAVVLGPRPIRLLG